MSARELTLAAYADLLVTVLGRNAIARRAASLLRGDVPDEEAAALDAHARALRCSRSAAATWSSCAATGGCCWRSRSRRPSRSSAISARHLAEAFRVTAQQPQSSSVGWV